MEQMTTRQMRDFLRAAGRYELEIDELTREARELTGDVLPHYSGWHVSGTGGRTGGSMVESAVTAAEKKRQRAACLMREVLRMKRELAFLDSLTGLHTDFQNGAGHGSLDLLTACGSCRSFGGSGSLRSGGSCGTGSRCFHFFNFDLIEGAIHIHTIFLHFFHLSVMIVRFF